MQTLPYKKRTLHLCCTMPAKGAGFFENYNNLQYRNFIDFFNMILFGVTSQKQR